MYQGTISLPGEIYYPSEILDYPLCLFGLPNFPPLFHNFLQLPVPCPIFANSGYEFTNKRVGEERHKSRRGPGRGNPAFGCTPLFDVTASIAISSRAFIEYNPAVMRSGCGMDGASSSKDDVGRECAVGLRLVKINQCLQRKCFGVE